jgi:tetratricopeptide (TPR) repeat protein
MLDQAELLQLALNASGAGDSASAIAYLKEAVSRGDASATAHYLLGAEYAQIKMYERAIGEMEAAIALDPNLSIARLQLGMLWLGANNSERAADVLRALEDLSATDPLHQFGAGLQHLIGEQLADALRCLTDGVALNTSNPALNGDMQSIVRQIELAMAGGAAPAAAAAPEDDSQHVLLSAYTSGPRH